MRVCVLLLGMLLTGMQAMAQYPEVTIREIQEVPLEDLLRADTLQNTSPSWWILQRSPLYGDTVTITAVVVAPAKVITFTAGGFTMVLYDTGAVSQWGAILVRVNSPTDSAQIILDGFLAPQAGDIIRMTGLVSEYPPSSMNSVTQFQPIAGMPITILNTVAPPKPTSLTVGDFYEGLFPGGEVKYSTGEPYEGMYVELTNLTVDGLLNTGRGTFTMVDGSGNQIADYDMSRYFTKGHGDTPMYPADPEWQYFYDSVLVTGATIDTIRGTISTASGMENSRGYRIAPLFKGDVVLGDILPGITTHRRNPVVVGPDSAARISVRAFRQFGGSDVSGVALHYRLDDAPSFTSIPMTLDPADTLYKATIPQQPVGTLVSYFVEASDVAGNSAILASSALGGFGADTSKGFFFYTVLDRPLTIHDIQYTPYVNGRTAYLGAEVTVGGIVTADTAHIGLSPLNTAGANAWFIQNGNEPWSGMWVTTSTDTTMCTVHNGDSILVTGTVQEQFDVTRVGNVAEPVVIVSSGNPVPEPVLLQTGDFGPTMGSGSPSAEPYEDMLVRFENVTVVDVYPTYVDPTEYSIDDGSGPVLVRQDGRNSYSNVPDDTIFGKQILYQGNTISSMTGVMYYSFNRYKLTPRADADFGVVTSVDSEPEQELPRSWSLAQNYPNPFNPATQIRYSVPVGGPVRLTIYNLLGQVVATLVDEVQPAGTYTARFDATHLASGVYVYRLSTGTFTDVKKMMLLK
jgi:hypothetical protein